MEPAPPDSPIVQRYLETFSELERLVTSDQGVPDAVWVAMLDRLEALRTAWADMNAAEREHVEQRTRRAP